jgi:adenylosuccinate synthase
MSGQILSGKTSLRAELESRFGLLTISTSDLIRELCPEVGDDRAELQKAGHRLDKESGSSWVGNGLGRVIAKNQSSLIVLDCVRSEVQLESVYRAIGARNILHVHVFASEKERRKRFKKRGRQADKNKTFEEVNADPLELAINLLAEKADIAADTERCSSADLSIRIGSRLGLLSVTADQLVDVIIGGQYGSEGKGNIADYLSPEYDVLVRVGGPNAGHIVYEEPNPYTHISLPCGTRRNDKAKLLIGPGAVIHEDTIYKEISDCNIARHRIAIDPQAVIITDEDIEWEKENLASISSTFNGVGAASARRLRLRKDEEDCCRLAKDSSMLSGYIDETRPHIERAYSRGQKIQLEGTQGTGLSVFHGTYPFVTSRDTTVAGGVSEAGIAPRRVRKITMVVRTFPIRVGGPSGPINQQTSWKAISKDSGIPVEKLRGHEKGSRSGKKRRVGEFDWQLLKTACHLNSPTDIALTFADYISIANRNARRFDQLSPKTIDFIEEVERVSGTPCSLIGTDFTERCIIDRRGWK